MHFVLCAQAARYEILQPELLVADTQMPQNEYAWFSCVLSLLMNNNICLHRLFDHFKAVGGTIINNKKQDASGKRKSTAEPSDTPTSIFESNT